jgi:uncharacterized protein
MPAPETDPGSLLQPLSDADIEEFARLLGADWAPDTTMDVEQLDGFLAGLICSPRMVMPSAYVPEIFGGEPQFPDLATTQRFYGLLMRRNNQIAEALNAPIERLDDPRAYVPLLLDWSPDGEIARSVAASGETPPLPLAGELWARGFMHAVDLTREDWEAVPEGDDEGAELVEESLAAIMSLVPEDDDAGAPAGAAAGEEDERDVLIGDALIAAYDLREYWRDVEFERIRVKEPIRREAKIGRNDLCPCGSGRKFKQCHGRGH